MDFDPARAPSGNGLAFGTDRGGEPRVYVIEPHGGHVSEYARFFALTPAFSPDSGSSRSPGRADSS